MTMTVVSLLINSIFKIYIFILFARFVLQKQQEGQDNPIFRFMRQVTDVLVNPLNKVIPSWRGYELSILPLMFVLNVIQMYILFFLTLDLGHPGIVGVLVVAVGSLVSKITSIFFWTTIFSVILSWVPALQGNAVAVFVRLIAEPLLKMGRKYVPLVAGLDLSPILILLVMQLIVSLIGIPLVEYGTNLAAS